MSGFDDWGDDWSTTPASTSHSAPANQPKFSSAVEPVHTQTYVDDDVYVIRGVNEVSFRGYGTMAKLFKGVPMGCTNQVNLSLMKASSIGHGGGSLNGIIYGKIENQALSTGMKVKAKGKFKRGRFIISNLYDVDSGNLPILVNKYWRDPLDKNRNSSHMNGYVVGLLCVIVFFLFILLKNVLSGNGFNFSMPPELKLIFWVAVFLAFIKIFNINLFSSPTARNIIWIGILLFIGLFVPGGDQICVIAIMAFAIYYMIKKIL